MVQFSESLVDCMNYTEMSYNVVLFDIFVSSIPTVLYLEV